jgi:hypothetical protein
LRGANRRPVWLVNHDGANAARWSRPLFVVYSATFAVVMAWMVGRSPLQFSDAFNNLSGALSGSVLDAVTRHGDGTYRPFGTLLTRLVSEVSAPHEAAAFRWLWAGLTAAIVATFAWVLRVRSWQDATAGTIALSVLAGHHAFRPTLLEAYPINHFGLVVLTSLLAIAVVRSPPGWLADLAAPALVLVGVFTLESGILVAVVFVAAHVLGFPGATRRGVVLVIVVVAAYLGARLAVLPPGTRLPPLGGHRSGFGFSMLEVDRIRGRFGADPWLWNLHNIAVAVLSTLLSEPREGAWEALRAAESGTVSAVQIVELGSSALTTGLLLFAAWRLGRADAGESAIDDRRMLALCGLAILANAVACTNYVKDDILSAAAAFYAIACYVAVRRMPDWSGARAGRTAVVLAGLTLAALSTLWALRVSDTACEVRYRAFVKRNDWAAIDFRDAAQGWNDAERELGFRMRRAFVNLPEPPPAAVRGTWPCLIREP